MTRPIKYGPWISRNPGDADPEPGRVQIDGEIDWSTARVEWDE